MDEAQIAKLVLGYLKSGNYNGSYKDFYEQCPHFDIYRQRKQMISTRYYGLHLTSILQQYYEIYSIVQPLLEETNYYEHTSFSTINLPEQVAYLICTLKHSRRPFTPCTSPKRQYDMENNPHSHLSSVDMSRSLAISMTPYESLPHNGQELQGKAPHRPSGGMAKSLPARREAETKQENSSGEGNKAAINDVSKVFKETLLGSENLQEKFAHTIHETKIQSAADVLDNSAENIVDFSTLHNAHDESPTILQTSTINHSVVTMHAGQQHEHAQSDQASNEFGIFSYADDKPAARAAPRKLKLLNGVRVMRSLAINKKKEQKVEKVETKKLTKNEEMKMAPIVQVKARSKKEKPGKENQIVWKDLEKHKKDGEKVLEGDKIAVKDGHTKNEKKVVLNDEKEYDKTNVNIGNKVMAVKKPIETFRSDEELWFLNGMVMKVRVEMSKDIVRCTPMQGSTEDEARMGFSVTEREETQESNSNFKQKPVAIPSSRAVDPVVGYETFVQYPKEEQIAHCQYLLNNPEKEYNYLDHKLFTDPIAMMASENAPEARRDAEDDKYETGAKIEKVEVPVAQPAPPKLAKKKKINVLNNIIVKQTLCPLIKSAIGEKMAWDKNVLEQSDDKKGKGTKREKLFATITTSKMLEREKENIPQVYIMEKKRKTEQRTSEHDDITKMSKMTENYSLLKELNVANFLEQLYNN